MKTKGLKIAELRESKSKILLSVLKEKNSRRPRKGRMKRVFSCQMLPHKPIQVLSHDCVSQRNVT